MLLGWRGRLLKSKFSFSFILYYWLSGRAKD